MRSGILLAALLAIFFLGLSCSSEDDPPEKTSSLASYYVDQCVKISACTGQPLASCFGDFYRDDLLEEDIYYLPTVLAQRGQCLAQAQDCEAVSACVEQASAQGEQLLSGPPKSVTCGAVEEVKCADDQLVWCFLPEYEVQARAFVFDLQAAGKTCNAKGTYAADKEHTSCSSGSSEQGLTLSPSCDGALLTYCVDGELLSWDCRDIDPEFRCVVDDDDDARCGMPEDARQCEEFNYYNNGNSASCAGNVAQVCAGGKLYSLDCGAYAGAVCSEDEPGTATCTL